MIIGLIQQNLMIKINLDGFKKETNMIKKFLINSNGFQIFLKKMKKNKKFGKLLKQII